MSNTIFIIHQKEHFLKKNFFWATIRRGKKYEKDFFLKAPYDGIVRGWEGVI